MGHSTDSDRRTLLQVAAASATTLLVGGVVCGAVYRNRPVSHDPEFTPAQYQLFKEMSRDTKVIYPVNGDRSTLEVDEPDMIAGRVNFLLQQPKEMQDTADFTLQELIGMRRGNGETPAQIASGSTVYICDTHGHRLATAATPRMPAPVLLTPPVQATETPKGDADEVPALRPPKDDVEAVMQGTGRPFLPVDDGEAKAAIYKHYGDGGGHYVVLDAAIRGAYDQAMSDADGLDSVLEQSPPSYRPSIRRVNVARLKIFADEIQAYGKEGDPNRREQYQMAYKGVNVMAGIISKGG